MAELVKIRGLDRKGIRIGGRTVRSDKSVVIDLDDSKTRRDVSRHSAIGALVVVGDVPAAVVSGVVVSNGTGLTVDVTSGSLTREDGQTVTVAAADDFALTAADGTNPRIDLVTVNNATGAIAKVDGTAAATPAVPRPSGDVTVLAQVRVNAGATSPTSITDVAPRLA